MSISPQHLLDLIEANSSASALFAVSDREQSLTAANCSPFANSLRARFESAHSIAKRQPRIARPSSANFANYPAILKVASKLASAIQPLQY